MLLPQFHPMPFGRVPEPFSPPDWLYEIKWDGFRALLYSDKDGVRLLSRNGNVFKSFPELCDDLARDLRGRRCVLDGEIVCLDAHGKSQFRDLLFRRAEPFFYKRLLYCDHIEGDGEGLFRLACEHDLEGIVAKHKYSPYLIDGETTWFKIRNRSYSQWVGREELFEREREVSRDLRGWDMCAIACAAAETFEMAQH